MAEGFFQRLFGKRPDPVVDGPTAADVKAKLEAMSKPAVGLTFEEGAPVRGDPHSSIGGAASLPLGESWPSDQNGRPMLFLAQINYADMPTVSGYPERGLLSLFVADDEGTGCDFPSRDQSRFLTRFSSEPEGFVRAEPPAATSHDPYGAALRSMGAPLVGTLSRGYPNSVLQRVEPLIMELTERMPTTFAIG